MLPLSCNAPLLSNCCVVAPRSHPVTASDVCWAPRRAALSSMGRQRGVASTNRVAECKRMRMWRQHERDRADEDRRGRSAADGRRTHLHVGRSESRQRTAAVPKFVARGRVRRCAAGNGNRPRRSNLADALARRVERPHEEYSKRTCEGCASTQQPEEVGKGSKQQPASPTALFAPGRGPLCMLLTVLPLATIVHTVFSRILTSCFSLSLANHARSSRMPAGAGVSSRRGAVCC